MEHDEGWAIRLAADIGRSVAYHRSGEPGAQGRRMSAQALASRCAELGLPIGRVAITKLENGIREKAVEVLPARPLDPWHATLWLSGDARLSENPAGSDVVPASNISAIPLHREHDRLTAGLAGYTRESLLDAGDDSNGRLLRLGVGALRDVRAFIRELGLTPPALPPGLAWVDEPGA